MDILSLGI